uniref:Uncharacterized protein n=1 Tax=Ralstonia syzygii R24 TaxID=907261 RepID=G3A283_9RALS|nr:hypothetical protein RALSY_20114 [Ralstonia syzygii R24]
MVALLVRRYLEAAPDYFQGKSLFSLSEGLNVECNFPNVIIDDYRSGANEIVAVDAG